MATVTLLAHTPLPEMHIASAAKLCYSPAEIERIQEDLTPEKIAGFVDMLAQIGHESPMEHAVFTFGIQGVSRALLAQITRHRIASFSVQSQRYVTEFDFDYVVPPHIAENERAKAVFLQAMEQDRQQYEELTEILTRQHAQALMEKGKDEKTALRLAQKMAIEDARFVLPNACETKMIVTMNARALMNFFALRCCKRAQWEIRQVAVQMLRLVKEVAPHLFADAGPNCVRGACSEGKMTCGEMTRVRAFFRNLGQDDRTEELL